MPLGLKVLISERMENMDISFSEYIQTLLWAHLSDSDADWEELRNKAQRNKRLGMEFLAALSGE